MTPEAYWRNRAINRLLELELIGNGYAERLTDLYQSAFRSIQKDLDTMLERFMEEGQLTPEEAMAYLKEPADARVRALLRDALNAIDDPAVQRKIVAQINSASYSARMTRLRAVQERIRIECARVAEQEIAIDQEAARRIGNESFYRTVFDNGQLIGAMPPFTDITLGEIDSVLRERWMGEDFSTRVWANTSAMADRLTEIARVNAVTGRSYKQCLKEMANFAADHGSASLYAAERLLRTETNRVANESSAKASEEAGHKEYIFMAILDLRTSEPCRLHDGRIDPDTKRPYTYKNRKVGVNFPPLHPWCRSVETPAVNAKTLKTMERAAKNPITGKDEMVPANWTYQDWYRHKVSGNAEAEFKEKAIKHTAADRAQHARYRDMLGKECPMDLAGFQQIKYTDSERWGDLKGTYRDVHWMRTAQANGIERGAWHKIPQMPPNTVADKCDENGNVLTRRYFGKTGKPRKDIDLTDHGRPLRHKVVPHVHNITEEDGGSYHVQNADSHLAKCDWIANDDLLKGVIKHGYEN